MNLSAMLDGELSGAELTKTVRHLAECESCMAEFQRFQNLQARVDEEYAVEQVPKTGWKDIQSAGKEKKRMIISFKSTWVQIVSAAAVLFIVFGVGYLFGKPKAVFMQSNTPIILASDRGRMDEDRFLHLTRELLSADPKYRFKMYFILKTLMADELEGGYDPPNKEDLYKGEELNIERDAAPNEDAHY